MVRFWMRLSTPKGPMPMLAVPPAMEDFSKTTTLTPASAAATLAHNPAGPAATMARSVVIFSMLILL